MLLPPAHVNAALRTLGSFDELGPHITVKAQPGLDDDRRDVWLPPLRRALAGFAPFAVQLGEVGTFGDDVVFLEVLSQHAGQLHELLVGLVAPPPVEAARHFELAEWHPHLTLHLGPGADVERLRTAVAELGPLPSFTVGEVWLCRQDATGRCVLEEPLSLSVLGETSA